MARWICFGELEIGRVEAADRAGAERVARRVYGARLVRVQSVASLEAAGAEGHDPADEDLEDDHPARW